MCALFLNFSRDAVTHPNITWHVTWGLGHVWLRPVFISCVGKLDDGNIKKKFKDLPYLVPKWMETNIRCGDSDYTRWLDLCSRGGSKSHERKFCLRGVHFPTPVKWMALKMLSRFLVRRTFQGLWNHDAFLCVAEIRCEAWSGVFVQIQKMSGAGGHGNRRRARRVLWSAQCNWVGWNFILISLFGDRRPTVAGGRGMCKLDDGESSCLILCRCWIVCSTGVASKFWWWWQWRREMRAISTKIR